MTSIWRVISSRSVLRDRWIDLRADDCVTPSGAEIKPFYVLGYPDWVHVVALTRDAKLVLVRQYRHGAGVSILELPGGMIDAADPGVEAAGKRELEEETGYRAARWQHVTTLFPNPATHTNRLHVLLACDAETSGARAVDAGEDWLAVELHAVADIMAGLRDGVVGNAMHASAILLGLAAAGAVRIETEPGAG